MKTEPQLRYSDDFGGGEYGASRGSRTHVGNDWSCLPGTTVLAAKAGIVTKLGYPYAEDLSFRYVEVRDVANVYSRYMYVEPTVRVGDIVQRDGPIGHCQDIANYHINKDFIERTQKAEDPSHIESRTMINHFHHETFRLVDGKKKYFDSRDYI